MAYCIKDGYKERLDNDYCDERDIDEQCQRAVYERASKLPGVRSVIDLGCGSGARLLEFFPDRMKLGLDLPPTVAWLDETYPDRYWNAVDLSETYVGFDLMICADMIEHVADPDAVVQFIQRCRPRQLVISTPDRDRLQAAFHDGPPKNLTHVREWSFSEFAAYIGSHFEIIEHIPAPPGNFSTQIIIARCL